jgi:hypothetical protein
MVAALQESPAASVTVDVQPAWRIPGRILARDPLDGLSLALPSRGLVGNGAAVAIAPQVLQADLDGTLELHIPVNEPLETGIHALRPTRESLCAALTGSYPNSTFLLPPDLEGLAPQGDDPCSAPTPQGRYDLARIGSVQLVRETPVPTFRFHLSGDGQAVGALRCTWEFRRRAQRT